MSSLFMSILNSNKCNTAKVFNVRSTRILRIDFMLKFHVWKYLRLMLNVNDVWYDKEAIWAIYQRWESVIIYYIRYVFQVQIELSRSCETNNRIRNSFKMLAAFKMKWNQRKNVFEMGPTKKCWRLNWYCTIASRHKSN